MKVLFALAYVLIISSAFGRENYPARWWTPIPEDLRYSWEILPQEAGPGEVILSKRHQDLGLLSNFAATPFKFEGVEYASIEGLWQGMKYVDPNLKNDPRTSWPLAFTRAQVFAMAAFEAKEAGSAAGKLMKQHHFTYVTYKGEKIKYKDFAAGSERHYQLIFAATLEKVLQNANVKDVLLKTKGLILKPDHAQEDASPKAYLYYEILMDIRDNYL